MDELFETALRQKGQGDLEQAIDTLRRLLFQRPSHVMGANALAELLLETNQTSEAKNGFAHVLQLDPNHLNAALQLGFLCIQEKKPAEAAYAFHQAVRIDPCSEVARRYYGIVLNDLGDFKRAVDALRRAVELDPSIPDSHLALGVAFKQLKQFEESASCYQKAIELNPTSEMAYTNLGNVFEELEQFDEAVQVHEKAASLSPNNAIVLCNYGQVLRNVGRLHESLAVYDRAIHVDPGCARAQFNRSHVLFLLGDFERGFETYEWRWKYYPIRDFGCPEWDGSSLQGKSILLYAEQGLGDTIQFIRYVSSTRQRASRRLIVECQPALVPLLSCFEGIDEIVARGSRLPEFDVQAPLMSLPRILKLQPHLYSPCVPYLHPKPNLVEQWRSKLAQRSGFNIGICWQGSATHMRDRIRSVPLSLFSHLANLPGVNLISLQKGAGTDQIRQNDFPVIDFADSLDEANGPFMDTSALIASLDLVISIDSAIAHMSGALGVKTWIVLSTQPDWRWTQYGTKSPWYPTVRLFRQEQRNDWESVFRSMRDTWTMSPAS
ncbi:MAG: tetratricopeptide repeat-containing glycosyltransferase family protein [Pirellula sp.]